MTIAADLLIFDLDGTLVDTRRDLANAINFVLKQKNRPEIDVETVTRYVGDGAKTFMKRAFADATEDELESALQNFGRFYAAHVADFSAPYPGIVEVLQHFHEKKKVVLSNKPQSFTDLLLQNLHLDHHFDRIIGGKPGAELKPSPHALFNLLETFNVPPACAVMIGDGENDVLAGKAAGLITCAVTYGYRPVEALSVLKPDYLAHNPSDLMALIR